MTIPSAEDQIRFLRDIQALLEDGQFTATYKFALLIALSDFAVESGVSDDRELPITLTDIARKFIAYYWQQSAPYIGQSNAQVLFQNTGRQAAVVTQLIRLRLLGISSLADLRRDSVASQQAVRKIARIVREMPLFKLQYVGGSLRTFLYPHAIENGSVLLNRGVAYHLRQFHTLITGLARDRWAAMVQQLRENLYLVGQTQDLGDFLFGTGREPIRQHLDLLLTSQHGRCLYCQLDLPVDKAHVDHFVPWVLHRCDAVPNLVAAHAHCNLAKKDWLAAESHLQRWGERNSAAGSDFIDGDEAVQSPDSITDSYGDRDDRHPTAANLRLTRPRVAGRPFAQVNSLARWAYDRAYDLGVPTWLKGREVQRLSSAYRSHLPD